VTYNVFKIQDGPVALSGTPAVVADTANGANATTWSGPASSVPADSALYGSAHAVVPFSGSGPITCELGQTFNGGFSAASLGSVTSSTSPLRIAQPFFIENRGGTSAPAVIAVQVRGTGTGTVTFVRVGAMAAPPAG
jgi:hypothetical protein